MVITAKEGQLVDGGTLVYVPVQFDASVLTVTEARVLRLLMPAARAINVLMYTQKGGPTNARLYETTSRIAETTDSQPVWDYGVHVAHYGGPWDKVGNRVKPPFSRTAWLEEASRCHIDRREAEELYSFMVKGGKAPPGTNVVLNETDMTNGLFAKWARERYNRVWDGLSQPEKLARTDPFLRLDTRVVVNGRDGRYKIKQTPWEKYEPARQHVKTAAEAFLKAAEDCSREFPGLSAILKATATGMHSGNFDARDVLLPRNDSRLYVLGGLTEEYIGAQFGWEFVKKGAFDLIMGLQNKEGTKKAKKARDLVPKFIATLPKDLQNDSIVDTVIHALDIAFLAGDCAHEGYTVSARNWPNSEHLKDAAPYIVYHGADARAVVRYLELPTVRALWGEDEAPDDATVFQARGDFMMLHELNHRVGKRIAYDAALEEGRASAGALKFFPVYAKHVGYDNRALERFCKVVVPRMFRAINTGSDLKSGAVTEHHAIGEHGIIRRALGNGGIEIRRGKIEEIKPRLVVEAGTDYFMEALRLERFGTPDEIKAFIKPDERLSPEARSVLGTLKRVKLPKGIYRDRGTVNAFEARLDARLHHLRAYPVTA